MTSFPSVIDSTILGTFRACPEKARLSYVEHWKPGEESVHLIAGGAFAKGIEVARDSFYVQGRPAEEAIADGWGALVQAYGTYTPPEHIKSAKTWDRVAGALEYYFDQYPLGADGATPHFFGARHGIEFSFASPLDVRHPETGDPIIYAGRADMVADSLGGLFLYDEKTTTSLGASWIRQWDLRSQFTGYCWGLREYGYKPAGVVVRGIAILKESYATAEAITYRADWEINRWLAQTTRDVRRMVEAWETGLWDYNLDHACQDFGGCAFTRVCKSPPENADSWLPMYFTRRAWNPLTREETHLE